MALNTKSLLTIEPGMELVRCPFRCMATNAGHDLSGPRVENIFTYRMSKNAMLAVALAADLVDGVLHHCRVI